MPSLSQVAALAAIIIGGAYVAGFCAAAVGVMGEHPIFVIGLLPVAIILAILGILLMRRRRGDPYDDVEK